MKNLHHIFLVIGFLFVAHTAAATIIVNQTNWPDGNSVILKTNQNLPNTMGWQCGTAAAYYASNGVLTLLTPGSSSRTTWCYFADSNNPVQLNIGEKIQLTAVMVFTNPPPLNTSRSFRFGLLYSGLHQQPLTNVGTANGLGVVGYLQNMNLGTQFTNGPLQTSACTNLNVSRSIFSSSADFITIGSNGGGVSGDGGIVTDVPYTLVMTVAHTASNTVDVTTSWFGSSLVAGMVTQTVTDTNYAYTNFDGFCMRPNSSASAPMGDSTSITSFKVEKLSIASPDIRITSIVPLPPQSMILTWNTTPGSTYSLHKTNNLTSPVASWPAVVIDYPIGGAIGSSITFTDVTATATSEFYKVSSP